MHFGAGVRGGAPSHGWSYSYIEHHRSLAPAQVGGLLPHQARGSDAITPIDEP